MDRIGALFDLDKTLLDTSSGQLYASYLFRIRQMTRRQMAQVVWWGFLTRLGRLNMQDIIPFLAMQAAGGDEQEMRLEADRWFVEDVVPHIAPRGQVRLAEHQAQDHVIAIVSASTQYVVGPMAAYLGIPGQYVCTHLRSDAGRLTGQIEPPACYGEGKIVWAERFAAEYGVDLGQSYFYTDSISDLPLLERVGHPVAVNPDPRLRRLARRRGWPVERFY